MKMLSSYSNTTVLKFFFGAVLIDPCFPKINIFFDGVRVSSLNSVMQFDDLER